VEIAKLGKTCGIVIIALSITFLPNRCFGQDQSDSVQQLINVIMGSPALYRTPEAADYFSRLQPAANGAASQVRESAVRGLRAAVRLGDMGERARAAIPALIDMFPQLEHVVTKMGVHYTTGNGTMEDWVQTFLVTEKSKFSFSSPFIEYASISKCENWMEAVPVTKMLSKRLGSGGRIVDAVADIYIILRVNAGACALARITGADAGNTREEWRKWRQRNGGGTFQAVAPSTMPQNSSKFNDIAVGGKYKIYLVTGDSLAGTVTSMDDTSVVFDTDGRRPYTFRTVLIKKYEVVALPVKSSLQPAAVISPPSGETTPLSYEDLFSVTMKGKTIEITTRNGSFFKGTLMSVGPDIARLNVDGMEVPISRKMIAKIALLSK
jgi:ribosome maturation factor RimP